MTNLKNADLASKLFYVLAFGIFIAILMRNSALYPSIFADEYNYSTASRLLPLSQAPIANYLYLWTYRLTNVCGDGFLSCARILNTLFFILACPFIYQTAKRVCSKSIAKYIAILSIIGPINIYTANFMPEAMYFLAFWIFAWYTLGLNSASSLKSWFGVGVLIGVCMLIKPHGVFLLLPTSLYLVILFIHQKPISFKGILYCGLLMVCGAFITKLLIGFAIAGSSGISIFGHLYSITTEQFITATTGLADKTVSAQTVSTAVIKSKASISIIVQWLNGLSTLLAFWSINLRGHLLGLAFLFGLPLLVMIRLIKTYPIGIPHSSDGNQDLRTETILRQYAWFTLLLGGSLVLFASLFSGLVSLAYSGEILRMHMRYYNFSFPLLLMLLPCIFSAAKENRFTKKLSISEWSIWALITLIVFWSVWKIMHPYQPTSIDTPELRGITQFSWFFYAISSLVIVSLLSWPFFRAKSAALYIWVVIPLVLIIGTINVNLNIWENTKPDTYDRAGLSVKQLLKSDEISQLVVVGDNPISLSKVLFYLDNPKVSLQVIPGNATYELAMFPADKKWVLLMDGHPLASTIQNPLFFNGYILAGGSGIITLNLDRAHWPIDKNILFRSTGLFTPPEVWGAWSVDKVVTLQFTRALPEAFTLTMDARAFGPNINKPIILQLGNNSQNFTLNSTFEKKVLSIQNPQRVSVLKITIPKPTSPKELGVGEDERLLGVGIRTIQISW